MAERTVVVTGATRGLGRALAHGFAAAGWSVAGCGRSAEDVEALRAALGAPHRFDAVDLGGDGVGPWARAVQEALGAPHLLVNNAGRIHAPAPLWELDEATFGDVLATNVGGVHRVCRAFLPGMIARGRGVVVNLSSGWGRSAAPEVSAYCASKWAVEGLTRSLAEELPEGLAAVALNPGVIHTGMLEEVWGDGARGFEGPEAWARRAVPFLEALGPEDNGRALSVG